MRDFKSIVYLVSRSTRYVSEGSLDFINTSRYKYVVSFGTGLFFFVFLIVFLPFGVNNYDPDHEYSVWFLTEMSKFMGLSIGILLLTEFALKPIMLATPKWSALIAYTAVQLLLLAMGIFLLYNWLGNWHDFSWGSALEFVLNCSSIYIFPLVGIFGYFRYQHLQNRFRQIERRFQRTPDNLEMIHFKGKGKSDAFSVSSKAFLYAQAQDNYVALYYIFQDGVRKELLQASLSELVAQTPPEVFLQCHRSYAVNPKQVISIGGNRPLRLFLARREAPIHVSRSFRKEVLSRLTPPRNEVETTVRHK